MELLRSQLKNNAEVIIKLLEQDVDDAFGFSEEKVKTKFLEDIRYLLEISTSDIEEEDKDTLQYLIITTSCIKLQLQANAYMKYVAPLINSWFEIYFSKVFISFNLLKQTTLIEGAPIMFASDFYKKLQDIDDLYVKESLSLIESSNNALLTEELYYAIKKKNGDEFKRCLDERSANISTASRYLNIVFAMKQIFNFADIATSNNKTLDSLSFDDSFHFYYYLKYIMQFDNDNLTEKSYKELEFAVTYVLSYYNNLCKAFCTDRRFEREIAKEERWIDLCYNGITVIEMFDDEYEEQMYNLLLEIIRIGSIDVCNADDEEDDDDASCCTKESPKEYPMCLKLRSKLLEEQNINHISEDFLQRNFYGSPDIECIKYVFFGLGIKPSKDLLWKGKKKDLTAFISYLCNGRVDSEVWEYFSNYIKQAGKEDKGIYDGTGPSTTASKKHKEDFTEYFEKEYYGMTE